jgi:phage recombination protein Bet
MNAVSVRLGAPAAFSAAQLQLIRRTVANDCNDDEFNLFINVARLTGLDPFRKQIHALVFHKQDASKRRLAIITGIDGMRSVAARSLRYRPDEDEPQFEYDESLKGPLNPLGLVKAALKIYMRDEGGDTWRPVAGFAYWDEFAPIKDQWGEDEETGRRTPTGEQKLDGQWAKMGRVMLAKCAEAQGLRKAVPEDLSSVYERAELDQALVRDVSPSEMVEQANVTERLRLIGGKDAILFQLAPSSPLANVPVGQIADKTLETIRDYRSPAQLDWFESVNREALRDFWARSPGDALALKKELEAARANLEGAAKSRATA